MRMGIYVLVSKEEINAISLSIYILNDLYVYQMSHCSLDSLSLLIHT